MTFENLAESEAISTSKDDNSSISNSVAEEQEENGGEKNVAVPLKGENKPRRKRRVFAVAEDGTPLCKRTRAGRTGAQKVSKPEKKQKKYIFKELFSIENMR